MKFRWQVKNLDQFRWCSEHNLSSLIIFQKDTDNTHLLPACTAADSAAAPICSQSFPPQSLAGSLQVKAVRTQNKSWPRPVLPDHAEGAASKSESPWPEPCYKLHSSAASSRLRYAPSLTRSAPVPSASTSSCRPHCGPSPAHCLTSSSYWQPAPARSQRASLQPADNEVWP